MQYHDGLPRDGEGHKLRDLVMEVFAEMQVLVRQELQLAKHEMHQELNKAMRVATSGALAAGLAGVAALLLVLMVVHLLATFGLPLWAAYGVVVAVVLLLISLLFVMRARSAAKDFHVTPQRTIESVKETATWLKNQTLSRI